MNTGVLKSYLEKLQREQEIPGLDCAVYRFGESIFRYRIGYADMEEKKAVEEGTLYQIH